MEKQGITVHKFGGTSLQNAEAYRHIAKLIEGNNEAIILSASANTTASLQELINLASKQQPLEDSLQAMREFQTTLIKELLKEKLQQEVIDALNNDINTIHSILIAIEHTADATKTAQDRILSYGEIWSTRLMSAYLAESLEVVYIDASKLLFVSHEDGVIQIEWQQSQQALDDFLQGRTYQVLIIPGFIASTLDGKLTTLGLNGSDFSAAIFSKLLQARQLIKWTDVDGVHSADPRIVPSAFPIHTLTYEEAMELTYFGANIIHPRAIYPAVKSHIPIYIKNTHRPDARGTLISAKKDNSPFAVKGLTSIEHVALINIQGSGMIGVSGIAATVFKALHLANISVILISQASSEHSICFAVTSDQVKSSLKVLNKRFDYEIKQQLISSITAMEDCSIIAAVGDNMAGSPGIAGKLFKTLGKSNINIRAISQGSSEKNISAVIQRDQLTKALRVVHSGFYLSNKTISIGLIGPGGVGSALLEQIKKALPELEKKYAIDLRVRGIANSRKMIVENDRIDLTHWEKDLSESKTAANLDQFISHIVSDDIPHAVIIDCTSSQTITDQYAQYIEKGLHIVSPNKKANSGNLDFYHSLRASISKLHRHYLYETTVCAGLPIIKTLQDLIQTGDEDITVEGVVSGTLAFIFDQLSESARFSEAVKAAHDAGYTEPDPRDDLAGLDVARKFVCLARELKYDAVLDNVHVPNLIPKELVDVDKNAFLTSLHLYDDVIHKAIEAAIQPNNKLRYVGRIDSMGNVTVEMKSYPSTHPFYNLKGTDNIILFHSKRYQQFPLVVQGPGAGTEVTAAGVFADLLRLASFL